MKRGDLMHRLLLREEVRLASVQSPKASAATMRSVLSVLLSSSDRAGRCWPSLSSIASSSELSLATVKRAIAGLELAGCLTRKRRAFSKADAASHLTTVYTLSWPRLEQLASLFPPPAEGALPFPQDIRTAKLSVDTSEPLKLPRSKPRGRLTMSLPSAHGEPGAQVKVSHEPSPLEPSAPTPRNRRSGSSPRELLDKLSESAPRVSFAEAMRLLAAEGNPLAARVVDSRKGATNGSLP
jgi:hypothetical protein